MQFLNPAVLAGLFAALIPLAIHLLHRGETRPVPFSNIRLLRTLQNDRMQKVRMRQWLLLLLRMLAIYKHLRPKTDTMIYKLVAKE